MAEAKRKAVAAAKPRKNPAAKPQKNPASLEDEYLSSVDLSISLKHTYPFKFDTKGEAAMLGTVKAPEPLSYLDPKHARASSVNYVELGLGSNGRKLMFPHGVTVVMGRSGAGKTLMTYHNLHRSNSNRGIYLSIDELETFGELIHPNSFAAASEVSMVRELVDGLTDKIEGQSRTDYIIIDSLRYMFYETSGGAAGKGGVNMGLFMKLTRLAHVAMQLKKAIIVVINPMTDDETTFSFYKEAAMGAVNAVIVVDKPGSAQITSRVAKTRAWDSLVLPRVGPSNEEIIKATVEASKGHKDIGRLLKIN